MPEEGTTPESETETGDTPTQPKPTETVDFWKAKAREQEKKARENASARAELDQLREANLSKEEKLQRERDDALTQVAQVRAEALRWKIAAKHGITDEDAELFLTAADEATLTRQAERLSARIKAEQPEGLFVPAEGRQPSPPALNSDDLESALKAKLGIA